jgi:hypothetical protein
MEMHGKGRVGKRTKESEDNQLRKVGKYNGHHKEGSVGVNTKLVRTDSVGIGT